MKKIITVLLAAVLMLSMLTVAFAADTPPLSYELLLTDQTGMPVNNPRELSEGDTLNVEIVLSRTDTGSSYDMYGIQFRLSSLGLHYNEDGKTLRSGTSAGGAHGDGDSH